MSKQTLRELAKDFAKGAISKEAYRKSRSQLINNIVAGNVIVKAIDYEAPLKPSNESEEAITEGIARDRTEITSPNQTPKPKSTASPPPVSKKVSSKKNKKIPFVFILVSGIIVLSLILAVILFYPKPPQSASVEISNTSDNANIPNDSTASTTTNSSLAGEALVGTFLNEKNWAAESLNKFIESWSALTQKERDAAIETKRMQRMKASIYKQFLEAKALASIDSEKAIMKQQKLIEFAAAIGLDDTRLVLD